MRAADEVRVRDTCKLPSNVERAYNLIAASEVVMDANEEGTVANDFLVQLKALLGDEEKFRNASRVAQANSRAFLKARRGKLVEWIRQTALSTEVEQERISEVEQESWN